MEKISVPHSTDDRPIWTVFGSVNENLPSSYYEGAAQLGAIAATHNIALYCGGSQLGLFRNLFQAFTDTRDAITNSSATITAMPWERYYVPEQDNQYDSCVVYKTLKEQQEGLVYPAQHLMALPGGVGTRAEIWNSVEFLRSHPAYATKHLWLLNIDGCYNGMHNDMRQSLRDGTAKEKDYARVHFAPDAETLAYYILNSNGNYPKLHI